MMKMKIWKMMDLVNQNFRAVNSFIISSISIEVFYELFINGYKIFMLIRIIINRTKFKLLI